MAAWQPGEGKNGRIGCGVLLDPAQFVRFVDAEDQYIALIRVTPGKPFVYYAGAGWSKDGIFPSFTNWEKYLRDFKPEFNSK